MGIFPNLNIIEFSASRGEFSKHPCGCISAEDIQNLDATESSFGRWFEPGIHGPGLAFWSQLVVFRFLKRVPTKYGL